MGKTAVRASSIGGASSGFVIDGFTRITLTAAGGALESWNGTGECIGDTRVDGVGEVTEGEDTNTGGDSTRDVAEDELGYIGKHQYNRGEIMYGCKEEFVWCGLEFIKDFGDSVVFT